MNEFLQSSGYAFGLAAIVLDFVLMFIYLKWRRDGVEEPKVRVMRILIIALFLAAIFCFVNVNIVIPKIKFETAKLYNHGIIAS